MSGAREGDARRVAVFGFDSNESSQRRRIRQLLDASFEVNAYTMRRGNMEGRAPFWRNVHLGEVENEALGKRLGTLASAVPRIAGRLGPVRRADVAMARNFDMLALAWIARTFALRPRLPLIYECLDIHGNFTADGAKGRLFRAIERFLLRRTALTVVSSPGFAECYLEPVQRHRGAVALLENKIAFPGPWPERRDGVEDVEAGRPLVLGWVGSLRCEPSFRILLETAERLGSRVRIEMHGNVHAHVVPDFEARIAPLANVRHHGPYAYPDDLGPIYRSLDLVWSQDLWQRGANSDWLLPNRIYEASYFACPSVAVEGTQTGRTVAGRGLGFALPEASADALCALLGRLGPGGAENGAENGALKRCREGLLRRPAEDFVYVPADIRAVVERAITEAA